MAAELKKVVVHSRFFQPDHFAPDLGEKLFSSGSWSNVPVDFSQLRFVQSRIINRASGGARKFFDEDRLANKTTHWELRLQIALNALPGYPLFGDGIGDQRRSFCFPVQDHCGLFHAPILHESLFKGYKVDYPIVQVGLTGRVAEYFDVSVG